MQSTVLTANELLLVRSFREVAGEQDLEPLLLNFDAVIAIVPA